MRIKNLSMPLPRNNLNPIAHSGSAVALKVGGSIIIQNWNTKTEIPKELEEYVNLPIIIDRNKLTKQKNLLPPIDKNYNDRDE